MAAATEISRREAVAAYHGEPMTTFSVMVRVRAAHAYGAPVGARS
jgi:hypothetical protein